MHLDGLQTDKYITQRSRTFLLLPSSELGHHSAPQRGTRHRESGVQIHFPEKPSESLVVANRIEYGVRLDRDNHGVTRVDRPIQPYERLIRFAKPEVDPGKARRRNIRSSRDTMKLFEQSGASAAAPIFASASPRNPKVNGAPPESSDPRRNAAIASS